MVEFGMTLARLRRGAGLSQLSLARALNLDPLVVERLERGDQRAPDRDLVLDISTALDLTEAQTDELLWAANQLPRRTQPAAPSDLPSIAPPPPLANGELSRLLGPHTVVNGPSSPTNGGSFGNGHGAGPGASTPGHPVPLGNDVSRLEALAIHLHRHLRSRSWSYITFVRFLSFLAEAEVFGTTREEQLAWLSHAKEAGVLREEIVDDPTDPSRIARRFYLNQSHPAVERSLAIRARVGETVPTGGRGMAFGMVIDRLTNSGDLYLSDVQAKGWLTWFVEEGYLLAETVPHFRKEGVTVTLLRQAPGYWESELTSGDESDTDRLGLAAEFASVRLADFLERHPHFAWMALSQLLNQMTEPAPGTAHGSVLLSRQSAKQVVALAQERGYLAIEQIPNLKTGGATTVARLNRDDPRVAELVGLRDAHVHRLVEMLSTRPSVPKVIFQTNLVDRAGLTFDEAGQWIDLLVGEGLFLLDGDHDGASGSLRADLQDLIVSRVLYGSHAQLEPDGEAATSGVDEPGAK